MLATPPSNSGIDEIPRTPNGQLQRKEDITGGIQADDIQLYSHEDCASRAHYAANFRHIEEESNKLHPQRILQQLGDHYVVSILTARDNRAD
ncbi:MAG: hypothetical protein ACLS29_09160 [Prevotellamassilia sp.]